MKKAIASLPIEAHLPDLKRILLVQPECGPGRAAGGRQNDPGSAFPVHRSVAGRPKNHPAGTPSPGCPGGGPAHGVPDE